jgi:triosephosphate isomerase
MRKKIVAGNWKMNLNVHEAKLLFQEISAIVSKNNGAHEVLVFPSSIYIESLLNINQSSIEIGAQNFHHQNKGAFTGEVSAMQLKQLGCKWVLVGHSERRTIFHENDADLLNKLKAALENDLQVIYCCGESLNEREAGMYFEKIGEQIGLLKTLSQNEMNNIAIAYEPIWAIGTGKTASPAQAAEMHDFIRTKLESIFNLEVADSTSLLYGGSCSPQNAKDLFACSNIDGGLIGGASLQAGAFGEIIAAI